MRIAGHICFSFEYLNVLRALVLGHQPLVSIELNSIVSISCSKMKRFRQPHPGDAYYSVALTLISLNMARQGGEKFPETENVLDP